MGDLAEIDDLSDPVVVVEEHQLGPHGLVDTAPDDRDHAASAARDPDGVTTFGASHLDLRDDPVVEQIPLDDARLADGLKLGVGAERSESYGAPGVLVARRPPRHGVEVERAVLERVVVVRQSPFASAAHERRGRLCEAHPEQRGERERRESHDSALGRNTPWEATRLVRWTPVTSMAPYRHAASRVA